MTTKSPTEVDVEIGRRLRAARLARGMSQQLLAEATGVTFQQVQKYEKGTNRISASRLRMVASVLDVALQDLLPESRHEPRPLPALSPDAAHLLELLQKLPASYRRGLVDVAEVLVRTAREPS